MTLSPSFDDIFGVMARASLGDLVPRVVVPEDASSDDLATRFAIGLNILLDDLSLTVADGQRDLAERTTLASRLQSIADASREFANATSDPGRLLDVVARRLADLVGDMCAIRAVTEDGEWLESTGAAYHRDPALRAVARAALTAGRQRVGEGMAGRVAATGRALLIAHLDPAEFIASSDPMYRPHIEKLGATSAITVPLICRGQVVGVANLLRSSPDHPYDEQDLGFVQTIGDHAALAIGNARSYAAERAARDVAEQATSALRQSEARLSRLQQAGIIGVVVSRFNAEILEINDTLLDLVGYSRDEILSGRVVWSSLTPLEWRDADARAIEQLKTSGIATLREKEYIRKDGVRVPVLAGSATLEGGTECISFVLDLTGRKEAEAAVARLRAERGVDAKFKVLAAIVEASDDAIIGETLAGLITSWNQGAGRIFGYSAEEAVGRSIFMLVPPDREQEEAAILAAAARGEVRRFETTRQCKDGRFIDAAVTTSPVFDARGEVVGISKVARDITEQKHADRQRARLAAIVDFSDDAMIGLTTDGVITSWNRGAQRVFGYSAEEMVGSSFERLVAPGRSDEESTFLKQVALGEAKSLETVRRRKDGRLIDVSVTSSPVRDVNGRVIGISRVTRDTSDRRRGEIALALAKESAEAAIRELEAFSYSVAHDLRAPLRGMNGFSQLLLDRYAGELDARAQDWLSEIVLNARKMGELIDALLALARVTRGELKSERVDLSLIAREVASHLRALEPQRTVEIEVQDDLAAQMDIRLARVLIENLLSNAWKFTRDAVGARIELAALESEGALGFFIRDNGAGFDMAFADKLFAPFQRLHTVTEFPGTGIGLATVQRIVQRHGGRVWADGAIDRGATFYFTFPARALEATSS